ncbi:MAG: hypothetical protein AAGG53_10550 [Cyanobacteria bacterium P01_H01_bin.152]
MMSSNSTTSFPALKADLMFHLIGNFCTDIVTTSNLPLNKISRQQGGLIANHPVVEEPDEGKLSRTVQYTIVGGDPADEFNEELLVV